MCGEIQLLKGKALEEQYLEEVRIKSDHILSDRCLMMFALSQAVKGYANVHSNPPVGAVITKNKQIISTGYHGEKGLDHAEVVALNAAKNKFGKEGLVGAKLYVTLEPCNHFGKTPPCVDAILEAGIKEVVYGYSDPNIKASGGGQRLKDNSVLVTDLGLPQCKNVIMPWESYLRTKKKLVELWGVISLNGFILNEIKTDQKIFNNLIKRSQINIKKNNLDDIKSNYHISSHVSNMNLFDQTLFDFKINLFRLSVIANGDKDTWEVFNPKGKLKLILSRRFKNGIKENYECDFL